MPGYGSIAHRYRDVAVQTANPIQLVIMLYNAALGSLHEAEEQIKRGDIAGKTRSLNKCVAVISELQSGLDRARGGEIAASLDRLYDYVKMTLFNASAGQDTTMLSHTGTLLENLRAAWDQVAHPVPSGTPVPESLIPGPAAVFPAQPKSLNISI